MAARYWVGGTATWDATVGTKWATTSGGAGGAAVPTLADDVFLDGASGSVTITTTASVSLCRSIDCTGFTGTLSLANSGGAITVGDASGGALKFVAGMTLTLGGASCAIQFLSTSSNGGAGWDITTGGKTMPGLTFAGVGGKWVLQDSLTATGGTAAVTVTSGTYDTNNKTCVHGSFVSSAATARTLTFGSSSLTNTGVNTVFNLTTVTNLTITANTATVTNTGTNSSMAIGTINLNGMSLVHSGASTPTITTGFTCANYTRIGTAAKTDGVNVGGNFTVTGTLTLTGNSSINRLLCSSTVVGTNRTITATNVVLTNVDFQDITGAGLAGNAAWTGTSMGDALGNSNITFDAPATQTHTASAGGSWSDVTKWTSRVPLPQDNVVVDVNTTGTLTGDMPRLGTNIDFTGFAGTFSNSVANSLYGSLTLSAALTWTMATSLTVAGRGNHTITSSGKSLGTGGLTLNAPGGTYSLQDALLTTGALTVNDGTFTTNNFNVTCLTFAAASGRATTVNLGTSMVTLTSTAAITIWSTNNAATTINGGSSTVVVSTVSVSTRTFTGGTSGTKAFGTLTYTVANSPGQLSIAAPMSLVNLNVGSGRVLSLPSSFTVTVTGTFNVNGAVNGYVYLPGVSGNYVSTPDSAALSITGNFDVRVRVAMDDWTPAAAILFISKNVGSGNQRSFYLRNDGATGLLRLMLSADGTAQTTVASSVAPTVSDGSTLWVRATWRQSDGRVQFFTASGAVTSPTSGDWTQLGTNQTIAIASIFDSTAPVEISSADNGTAASFGLMPGKFYRAQIRNNILDDGTGIAFDADFTTKPFGANTFVESSANAATVTINGTLAQAGDGRVSLVSSTGGTPATLTKAGPAIVEVNYVSIQDSTVTGNATGWYAVNSVNVSGNTGWNFSNYIGRIPVESRRVAVSGRVASTRTAAVSGRV